MKNKASPIDRLYLCHTTVYEGTREHSSLFCLYARTDDDAQNRANKYARKLWGTPDNKATYSYDHFAEWENGLLVMKREPTIERVTPRQLISHLLADE